MGFVCDACHSAVSVGRHRAGKRLRCPRCGGSVSYTGLKSVRAAAPEEEPPITLTRVEPALRRAGRGRVGPSRELLVGAGVVAVMLFLLVGVGLYLVARAVAQPAPSEAAARVTAPSAPSEPELAPPVASVDRPRKPDAGTLPIREEPVSKTLPADPTPSTPLPVPPLGDGPQGVAKLDLLPMPRMEPKAEQKPDPKPDPQPVVQPIVPVGVPKSAVFMGTKALGKRFCIIADCSGSMQFNNRMVRLKRELARTLLALDSDQEFYVIYFSATAIPMPATTWRRGGRDVKRILPWVNAQPANGSTEPMPAFNRAFRLNPRPDAIFFLTDGIIPESVPDGVARLNAKARVPVHTILFGGELASKRPAGVERVPVVRGGRVVGWINRPRVVAVVEKDNGQLERVARDSGGTHRFVPDTPLAAP
jgi:hypothetical protein